MPNSCQSSAAILVHLRCCGRWLSLAIRAAGYVWSDAGDDLCGFAGVDPAAEDGDTLGGPCSVARHHAGVETLQDGVGVRRDVLEGPEIETGTHRVAVALAEQGLDVLLEADWLVWSGHSGGRGFRPGRSGDWCGK